MSARSKPEKGATSGNFVAEWFGHRVWNKVDSDATALANQCNRLCPFLSSAIGAKKRCIKSAGRSSPTGVCTISSDSNGLRQDWLACPYRTLDEQFTILTQAIRLLFDISPDTPVFIYSGEKIKTQEGKTQLKSNVAEKRGRVFVFMADKLGGEIDLPETGASPGAKVDVSVIEVIDCDNAGAPSVFGRHMMYEIQTADFHGSPLHAVQALEALCAEGDTKSKFHEQLKQDIELCGIGVEGPNKSNVFKRTFYQAVLKILMAEHKSCAGFVLILPSSVWDSWKRHLGNPDIKKISSGKSVFLGSNEKAEIQVAQCRSWIFVFDIEKNSAVSPHPLVVKEMIAASATALQEHAFDKAAKAALENDVVNRYRDVFSKRIKSAWSGKKR